MESRDWLSPTVRGGGGVELNWLTGTNEREARDDRTLIMKLNNDWYMVGVTS